MSAIDAQLVDGATVSGTVEAAPRRRQLRRHLHLRHRAPTGAVRSKKAVTSAAGAYRLADLAPQACTIRFDPTCSTGYGSYFHRARRVYPQGVQLSPGESLGGVDGTLQRTSPGPLWQ